MELRIQLINWIKSFLKCKNDRNYLIHGLVFKAVELTHESLDEDEDPNYFEIAIPEKSPSMKIQIKQVTFASLDDMNRLLQGLK